MRPRIDGVRQSVAYSTWNFAGLCSERKQKEVGQVLEKLNLDVVAGQESWERDGSVVSVNCLVSLAIIRRA